MKIASWATPEGLAGHMWPAGHGLSTTVLRRRLCLQQPAPAYGLTDGCVTMLSDCQLSHFVLIL